MLMLGEKSGVAGAAERDGGSAAFLLHCLSELGVGRSHESATSNFGGYK